MICHPERSEGSHCAGDLMAIAMRSFAALRTTEPSVHLSPINSTDRRMLLVHAGGLLPGAGDAVDHRLVEEAADELDRQRHTAGGEPGHHRQRRMAGDVERRARLARV